MSATVPPSSPGRERGQIIVIFALALVAIIAMVGLVLDGGSAFAQRRDEQSAADLAALAGANDYWLWSNTIQATALARTIAATNGYQHGTNGVTVNVTITTANGAEVKVDISAPHRNTFSSILGMTNWTVATTAQAQAGIPDTANGAGPILFSVNAFGDNGQPKAAYGNPSAPYDFGIINGDIPKVENDIAWTDYGTADNVDTDGVRDIIKGTEIVDKTLAFGEYIGQKNNGYHNDLFDDIDTYLSDTNIPVPIVDDSGTFQGWATFHVTSADKGSKSIKGYFVSPWVNERLTIKSCALGSCPRFFGNPTLHLIN